MCLIVHSGQGSGSIYMTILHYLDHIISLRIDKGSWGGAQHSDG